MPLDSTLDNGDTVEILTSSDENAHPKRDWLEFVQSTRARNKIRQWFTRERREDNVLHHLNNPIRFLNRAASKLKPPGKVIGTEPFFSLLSTPIFKYLHHEPVDFRDF